MTGLIGYRDQVAPSSKSVHGGPLRDIRKFIAQSQTKQMDPNEFPPYEYHRYPLMPLNKNGKPFMDTAGRTIVLRDPGDEDAFYTDHPELERVRDPQDVQNELEELRAENRRLRELKGDPNSESALPGSVDQLDAAPVKPKNGVAGLTKPPAPKPGSKLD